MGEDIITSHFKLTEYGHKGCEKMVKESTVKTKIYTHTYICARACTHTHNMNPNQNK